VPENGFTDAGSIYPNPANDHLTIEIPQKYLGGNLAIYNMNGQEILKREVNENSLMLDLSGIVRGLYFVRLSNDNFIEVEKIVKD
jgi:hypothetical protein